MRERIKINLIDSEENREFLPVFEESIHHVLSQQALKGGLTSAQILNSRIDLWLLGKSMRIPAAADHFVNCNNSQLEDRDAEIQQHFRNAIRFGSLHCSQTREKKSEINRAETAITAQIRGLHAVS